VFINRKKKFKGTFLQVSAGMAVNSRELSYKKAYPYIKHLHLPTFKRLEITEGERRIQIKWLNPLFLTWLGD